MASAESHYYRPNQHGSFLGPSHRQPETHLPQRYILEKPTHLELDPNQLSFSREQASLLLALVGIGTLGGLAALTLVRSQAGGEGFAIQPAGHLPDGRSPSYNPHPAANVSERQPVVVSNAATVHAFRALQQRVEAMIDHLAARTSHTAFAAEPHEEELKGKNSASPVDPLELDQLVGKNPGEQLDWKDMKSPPIVPKIETIPPNGQKVIVVAGQEYPTSNRDLYWYVSSPSGSDLVQITNDVDIKFLPYPALDDMAVIYSLREALPGINRDGLYRVFAAVQDGNRFRCVELFNGMSPAQNPKLEQAVAFRQNPDPARPNLYAAYVKDTTGTFMPALFEMVTDASGQPAQLRFQRLISPPSGMVWTYPEWIPGQPNKLLIHQQPIDTTQPQFKQLIYDIETGETKPVIPQTTDPVVAEKFYGYSNYKFTRVAGILYSLFSRREPFSTPGIAGKETAGGPMTIGRTAQADLRMSDSGINTCIYPDLDPSTYISSASMVLGQDRSGQRWDSLILGRMRWDDRERISANILLYLRYLYYISCANRPQNIQPMPTLTPVVPTVTPPFTPRPTERPTEQPTHPPTATVSLPATPTPRMGNTVYAPLLLK